MRELVECKANSKENQKNGFKGVQERMSDVTCGGSRLLSFNPYRYLDNVVNKQSVSPPIPHLHALLTSGDDPPEEVDIFDLLKVSYEVSTHQGYLARLFHWAMWVQLAMVGGWPLLCGST